MKELVVGYLSPSKRAKKHYYTFKRRFQSIRVRVREILHLDSTI